MSDRVRVPIVDDSASMRVALSRILSHDVGIEVVGMALEPHLARAMIKELSPDVLTLDIEMPGMDGLAFLKRIMRLRPMSVIMCSTLTARGTNVTTSALRLGAVECIATPSGSAVAIDMLAAKLCAMVKAAARATVRATPVLVVQHMPAAFTSGVSARLDRDCEIHVVVAGNGMPLQRGTAYVAPGGATHRMLAPNSPCLSLKAFDAVNGHRPSVDVLMHSVARLGSAAVGVILTGKGNDGARGLLATREAGARTLAQDRASSVAYGIPRAASELGGAMSDMPLAGMPGAIMAACRQ